MRLIWQVLQTLFYGCHACMFACSLVGGTGNSTFSPGIRPPALPLWMSLWQITQCMMRKESDLFMVLTQRMMHNGKSCYAAILEPRVFPHWVAPSTVGGCLYLTLCVSLEIPIPLVVVVVVGNSMCVRCNPGSRVTSMQAVCGLK